MNIIYLGGFDLPDKNAAAQRVIANAKLFDVLGYTVTLIGLDKRFEEFTYEGFDCINLKYPSNVLEWTSYLLLTNKYRKYIEKLKPQMIVAYNHPAFALNNLASLCKANGIKLISDCTEWYTPEGNVFFKLIKGWDTRKRMKKTHLKLDGIISISRYLHEYYLEKGAKSLLLPPLVDIENSQWDGCLEKTNSKVLRLVYAGSPGHKDRLDTIVNVISKSNKRNIAFSIIGIDEQQFRELYHFQESIPVSVSFKGRLSHADTLKELKTSDFQIFVREDNITTRAGFPTKFVESISAGIPVLTNLTSNIGDYLSDGNNGFVLDVSSEKSLIISLEKVFALSNEEILNVKQSIDRKTFDYHRYIPQMKEFIETL